MSRVRDWQSVLTLQQWQEYLKTYKLEKLPGSITHPLLLIFQWCLRIFIENTVWNVNYISLISALKFFFLFNLLIWLCQVLAVARGIFNLCWGIRDLAPQAGIKSGPHALGAWNLSHWTTREVTLPLFSVHSFFAYKYVLEQGFPGGTSGEEPTCQHRRCKGRGFGPWVRKIPWRRAWQPTPVFLPGESHGQRSLEG